MSKVLSIGVLRASAKSNLYLTCRELISPLFGTMRGRLMLPMNCLKSNNTGSQQACPNQAGIPEEKKKKKTKTKKKKKKKTSLHEQCPQKGKFLETKFSVNTKRTKIVIKPGKNTGCREIWKINLRKIQDSRFQDFQDFLLSTVTPTRALVKTFNK